MKKLAALTSVLLVSGVLVGCAGGGTYVPNRTIGAGVGAVTGGALGAVVSRGNPVATLGGAAVGGVAGYYIGRSTENRRY